MRVRGIVTLVNLLLILPQMAFAASAIGQSSKQRPLMHYQFGNGSNSIILVGAIHGGYEWNTASLCYQLIDYFSAHAEQIPASLSLHIIPVMNPDGLYQLVHSEGRFDPATAQKNQAEYFNYQDIRHYIGRFNGNNVDLNRNWGWNWNPNASVGIMPVNTGSEPFSEPETIAMRNFIQAKAAKAVVFYHSASGKIYGASVEDSYYPSIDLAITYANASSYPYENYFTDYETPGDAGDWLATVQIPSITVELSDHINTEYGKNLAGVMGILAKFSQ